MNKTEMQKAPGLSHHGALQNNSIAQILTQSAPVKQELVIDHTTFNSSPLEGRRNKFESFEQFQAFIRQSFIEGSGISPSVFDACVEFHQDIECGLGGDVETPIHNALGWDYKRFGHQANEPLYAAFLMNEDGSVWQVMVSLWDEDKERPYKYLAPKGGGNRAFFPPVPPEARQMIGERYGLKVPTEGSFWQWFKESSIERGITEGGKKTLCAISNGYVMMGLYGCECGATGINACLMEDLIPFASQETGWLIAFDQDTKRSAKKAVTRGTRKLHKALEKRDCYAANVNWDAKDGKGLDDLIVNQGAGAFDDAYETAIASLEKQFSKRRNFRVPPADKIGREIAQEYRDRLAFNNEIALWMRYEADFAGVWSLETNEFIEAIVSQILASKGIEGYNSHTYITNIVKAMRNQLIVRKWLEASPRELLPFINGVVEISTGKLLPHSPSYRLTWQLPRSYDPNAKNWSEIDAFLNHLSNGNDAIKDLLLCYCNAVIKGRHDLQKFIHLIGPGGTGKGSFSRLVVNLIGEQNVHTTTLEEWCNNRFEGANAYRKRLVLFPDEDKQTGKLGKFLSLTGEDLIRAEEKGKKAFPYRYDGMALVLSNLPIFMGESASRVKRRVITIPCNQEVPPSKRRNLEVVFAPELSAFTNYVLSIPDEHVTNVLLGLQEIPECALEFWENRTRVDSIAAWINQHIIYDPMAKTPVGSDRHEGEDGTTPVTLFGSYNSYCRKSGNHAKHHNNFSPDLLELCRSVLGWEVEKEATKTGKFIRGLRLRIVGMDDNIPTHDYTLAQRINAGDGSSDGTGDGTGDGSQSLINKDFDAGDGTIPNLIEEKIDNQKLDLLVGENLLSLPNTQSILLENQPQESLKISTPSQSIHTKGFAPSPMPSQSASQQPSPVEIPSLTDDESLSAGELNPNQADADSNEAGSVNVGDSDNANTDVQANLELIRDCIALQSWDMIEQLIQDWTVEFKSTVWDLLTLHESKAIEALKSAKGNSL
jgi:putative DNA primase/helicase